MIMASFSLWCGTRPIHACMCVSLKLELIKNGSTYKLEKETAKGKWFHALGSLGTSQSIFILIKSVAETMKLIAECFGLSLCCLRKNLDLYASNKGQVAKMSCNQFDYFGHGLVRDQFAYIEQHSDTAE